MFGDPDTSKLSETTDQAMSALIQLISICVSLSVNDTG